MSDKSIFEEAMEGVKPLNAEPKAPHIPTKKNKPIHTERDVSTPLPTPLNSVSAFETLEYASNGVQKQTLRKLKQGKIPPQVSIDLHKYTRINAEKALNHFINTACNAGLRCVRVVHGKGLHSDMNTPIIKNMVVQILTMDNRVMAYCSAKPNDGGTGAAYVLLKHIEGSDTVRTE